MSDRYKVIYSSETGHSCCFDTTVVDTAQPIMHGEHESGHFTMLCECSEGVYARRIAELLNKADNE